MTLDGQDPLAGLKEEIAAENAAADAEAEEGKKPTQVAKDVADDEDDATDETEGETEAEEGKKPTKVEEPKDGDKKPKLKTNAERQVSISRLNEEGAKRRKAERELEETQAELAALKKPAKDGDKSAKTEEEIRTEARAQARLEIQVENFINAAYAEYGQKEFDALSDTLIQLGAPDSLIALAVEATGTPALAAKAVFMLSQEDAEVIEATFKQSPIRLAATLAKFASTRVRGKKVEAEDEDNDELPPKKGAARKVSEAPTPLRPVNGSGRIPEGFGDEVSEEEFTKNFDKLLDNRSARH